MRRPMTFCGRTVAAALAIVLAAGAAPAFANTKSDVAAAKSRLHDLEGRIAAGESAVTDMQSGMRRLADQVRHSRVAVDAVQIEVDASIAGIKRLQVRYDAMRSQIAAIATQAYMQGTTGLLTSIMNADSISSAGDAIEFGSAIATHNTVIAQRAQNLAEQVRSRERRQASLLAARSAALAQLKSRQEALTQRFVDEQRVIAGLADAKTEVAALLTKLEKQLRAEELAAALAALAHGTPLSFGKWAGAFLDRIGSPVVRSNQVALVAWETAEYTLARWNPLATTMPMSGSTTFNSSRVQNYLSLAQGLDATLKTLQRPGHGYGAILAGLAHADDAMSTARAINASDWCHGCADGQYVVELIPSVEQYYDRYANARA